VSPIIPAELPALTINFEYGDSDGPECTRLPLELYKQFTAPNKAFPGYGYLEVNVSVVDMPDDIETGWWGTPESKWMRQKVRRAEKAGYEFRGFDQKDHIDDLHEINTSLEERQGKPMSSSYVAKPVEEAPYGDQPCPRHRREWFGVFRDGKLYAYTNVLNCGEMLLFSRILGHGEFMKDDIMNLLVFEAAKQLHEKSGTRYAVYFLHHSGTEGLQFFKRKMGFAGYTVTWELARPGVAVPELPKREAFEAPKVPAVQRVYRGLIRRVPAVGAVGKKVKKLKP
jgi:hypothetical protein